MKAPGFLAPLLVAGDDGRGCPPPACELVDQEGRVIATRVSGAFDATARKRGLLGRETLREGEALVIAPSNAIHTLFMRFPIDVVHVDRTGRVLKITAGLRPWRADAAWRGFAVVEMAAGAAARSGLRVGDTVCVVHRNPGLLP
jgi:uncharacterized protein